MTTRTATPKARTNRRAWDDDRYVQANNKLQEIKAKQDALEAEIDRRHTQQFAAAAEHPDRIQARHLVDGTKAPPDEPRVDLTELYRARRVLALGVEMAEKKAAEVQREVSKEIIAGVHEDYVALVEQAREHLAALAEIAAREAAFIEDMVDGGTELGRLQRVRLIIRQVHVDRFDEEIRWTGQMMTAL